MAVAEAEALGWIAFFRHRLAKAQNSQFRKDQLRQSNPAATAE